MEDDLAPVEVLLCSVFAKSWPNLAVEFQEKNSSVFDCLCIEIDSL